MRRNILITGASSGLGRALAEFYAKQGARLFLSGRDAARLADVVQNCQDLGGEAHTQTIAVEARDIMHQWVTGVDKRYPLDLVIANAGISGGTVGLRDEDFAAQSHRIFDVNLMGTLNTIDPVLPRMAARGKGQIALLSSMAGFAGWPGAPAYSASKAAIRIYGEALRGRYAKDGIGISVICPGFVATPMTEVNNFKMPFLMTPAQAAQKIGEGLACNKARIAFPWPVALVSALVGILPLGLKTAILSRAPEKTSLQKF